MQNPGRYLILFWLLFAFAAAGTDTPFSFKMQANKHEAYVGEPVKLTFTFSYPIDLQIAEANFAPPTFHDFWVKEGKKVPNEIKNGKHLYRLTYIITPQRAGHIEVEPARMDIGILKTKQKNTLRMERVKWKSIFSNALSVDVKPLPGNTTLFGDYNITATVDKNITKADEPVNLTLTIQGSGNIEEISDFTISSDKAAVYTDKPKVRTHFEKGLTKGIFTQKFVFISDRNFTIPSLSLTYFNANAKKIETIKTRAIPVTVLSTNQTASAPHLVKGSDTGRRTPLSSHVSTALWIFSVFVAFALGIIVTIIWINRKRKNKPKEQNIETAIKKAKDDKALLSLLLPYSNKDPHLDKVISELEANLYLHARHRIDRKKLAKRFKEYVTISPDDEEILL